MPRKDLVYTDGMAKGEFEAAKTRTLTSIPGTKYGKERCKSNV